MNSETSLTERAKAFPKAADDQTDYEKTLPGIGPAAKNADSDSLFNRVISSSEPLAIGAAVILSSVAFAITPAGRRALTGAIADLSKPFSEALLGAKRVEAGPSLAGVNKAELRVRAGIEPLIAPEGAVSAASHKVKGVMETPFPQTPWLTGRIDSNRVWVPTRDYDQLPLAAQQHVDRLYTDLTPMTKPELVSLFVQELVPAWEKVGNKTAVEEKQLARTESNNLVFLSKLKDLADHHRIDVLAPVNNFVSRATEPIPKFELEVFDFTTDVRPRKIMFFAAQNGAVGIRMQDILRLRGAADTAEQVARIGHEVGHGTQWYDKFKTMATRANLSKSELNYSDPFWDKFHAETTVLPSDSYKQRLFETWQRDDRLPTIRDQMRADILLHAHKSIMAPEAQFYDRAGQIEHASQILDRLNAGQETRGIVADLKNPEFLSKIVGDASQTPEAIKAIVQSRQLGSDTRETVGRALTDLIRDKNHLRQKEFGDYFNKPDELEAWLAEMRIRKSARQFLSTMNSTH